MASLGFTEKKHSRRNEKFSRDGMVHRRKKATNLDEAAAIAKRDFEMGTQYEVEIVKSGLKQPTGALKRKGRDWAQRLLSYRTYLPFVLILFIFTVLLLV
jgi:hypothetical protein